MADNKNDTGAKALGAAKERVRGTQAQKENIEYYRATIPQMLGELYDGDVDKIKAALIAITKNDSRGFQVVDDVAKLSTAALPVAYAKIKKGYTTRLGKDFVLQKGEVAIPRDHPKIV